MKKRRIVINSMFLSVVDITLGNLFVRYRHSVPTLSQRVTFNMEHTN